MRYRRNIILEILSNYMKIYWATYISDEDLTLDDTLDNNSLFDDHQGIEKDDFFSDTSVENDQGKNNTGRDIEEG